jgi:uncharacterized protein
MQISGRVVVITGASMGIGEALTREFVTKGAIVVMSSRDVRRVEEARMRVGAPEQTTALACDVTDRGQVQELVREVVERFGRIDVWVNNAGFGLLDSVANMDLNQCRAMFDTNLFGAIACMQEVLPQMKTQRSGAIINVSSVAGHIPVPYMAAYCATKHAMNAIGKAARMELKGTGVNVLTVCPGRVRTNFSSNTIRGSEGRRMGDALTRGISAERVARAVVRAYIAGKREIVVPWTNSMFIWLYRAAPGLVEFAMGKMMGSAIQRSESQR